MVPSVDLSECILGSTFIECLASWVNLVLFDPSDLTPTSADPNDLQWWHVTPIFGNGSKLRRNLSLANSPALLRFCSGIVAVLLV